MAGITLNAITNANVYINGNSLLGRAEEVKLPDIKTKMVQHNAVGMLGTIKLPGGFDALEGEIKWNSFYPDTWGTILNPWQAVSLQVRTSLESFNSQGRSAQKAGVTFITGTFYETPAGSFKQNDKAEFPSKFAATYIKQVVDGVDILEIDVMANIFKINGVDQLATYRANIGG